MKKRKGVFLAVPACLLVVGLAGWFLTSAGAPKAEAAVLAANKTEILFDGEEILGLKGFTYKVYKDRQDVRGLGVKERTGVTYVVGKVDEDGEVTWTTYGHSPRQVAAMMKRNSSPMGGSYHVEGTVTFISPRDVQDLMGDIQPIPPIDFADDASDRTAPLLTNHMDNNTSFQIDLSIMQDSYPEGLGIKQFTFDGCHVDDREFQIDSHGYALTTYTFTGDRIREE